jgi:hypothetical protein
LFYKETVRFFEQKLQASHELIYFWTLDYVGY